MKPTQIIKFIIALALCFGAGALGAVFVSDQSIAGWYSQLQKPAITPPDWVFGPVWAILYCLMAVSLFIIWNKGLDYPKVRLGIGLFLMQLALNAAWTPLFFGLHLILPALIDIILLLLAIIFTLLVFKRISLLAAALLLPYLLWVGYAAILNALIWQLNR